MGEFEGVAVGAVRSGNYRNHVLGFVEIGRGKKRGALSIIPLNFAILAPCIDLV